MLTRIVYQVFILLFAFVFTSAQECNLGGKEYPSFSKIKSIFEKNKCQTCHSSNSSWNFENYQNIFLKSACAESMINHGNAATSNLYKILAGNDLRCVPTAAQSRHKISNTELELLETWINQGAPENCIPFYEDVKITLDKKGCISCHNHSKSDGGWNYDLYYDILKNENNNCINLENIQPYNAKNSLLYNKLLNNSEISCGHGVEKANSPLTIDEITSIRDWINGGVPNNQFLLPINLTWFKANEIESKDKIELLWQTSNETNASHFIIEKSSDGYNFSTLDIQQAQNSNGGNYYHVDKNPFIGYNYYRLKMIDLDNRYQYSSIKKVNRKVENLFFKIAPNLLNRKREIEVSWYSKDAYLEETHLYLMDMNGKVYETYFIRKGKNIIIIEDHVPCGFYLFLVDDYYSGGSYERIIIIE